MTTQTELDRDLLEVLERHLESRRELLKRVKGELMMLDHFFCKEGTMLGKLDVASLMDRLIAEAKMPQGSVKG